MSEFILDLEMGFCSVNIQTALGIFTGIAAECWRKALLFCHEYSVDLWKYQWEYIQTSPLITLQNIFKNRIETVL
jgi:hypothetical protein